MPRAAPNCLARVEEWQLPWSMDPCHSPKTGIKILDRVVSHISLSPYIENPCKLWHRMLKTGFYWNKNRFFFGFRFGCPIFCYHSASARRIANIGPHAIGAVGTSISVSKNWGRFILKCKGSPWITTSVPQGDTFLVSFSHWLSHWLRL